MHVEVDIKTNSISSFLLQTFHTPSFGDEEFVDVPYASNHYQMDPQQQQHHHHHQYGQDVTQNMSLLDDQQNQYTLWNPDSQQMYINSNDYELQTNNQMYYTDPISNNQPIQSQHNNMMMPPPQKSPQITSPMSYIGQSPHGYGENGTTSDDSDDSVVRGANNLKRPSPEPLSDKMSPSSASKAAKATAAKKPKVQRKRKKKDPNEPQKPVSAYALFFRDTQAAIKGQNPNASFGEVSTIVASMWDVLAPEHKDVYKKKTEAAKAVYLKTLAAYRASVVSKGTDLESPPPQQQTSSQSQLSLQHSPHTQMNNSMSPHASPQQQQQSLSQLSQGLPIQHANQQTNELPMPLSHNNQFPTTENIPQNHQMQMHMGQPQEMARYGGYEQQQHHLQPMHQINNSNINQNHLSYGGYDHNQQQQEQLHIQPIHNNGLMDGNNGYHMQQQQQHHLTGVVDHNNQMTSPTGIAPAPNNVYHHQSNILQKCIRTGCTNQAITSPDWEDEYCSNECVINHCGDVFGNWISKNNSQQQSYSVVK